MTTEKKSVWIGEYVNPPRVGNQSLYIFNSMHWGKFLFVSQVFSKERQVFKGFYIDIGLYTHKDKVLR